jgi:hypothetical protein
MSNKKYWRRLIARVEALRAAAAMPMLKFHQQIDPGFIPDIPSQQRSGL